MKPAADTGGLPESFDGFRLVRLLGRGASGEVYLGHDELLDRDVAIKLVTTADLDEAARARVLTEARAVARLHHPNVVGIYRLGEAGGRPYLVTELVRGIDLVEVQLAVAEGRGLPQDVPYRGGHAIEVRLYAEDATYTPQSGRLVTFDLPADVGFEPPATLVLSLDRFLPSFVAADIQKIWIIEGGLAVTLGRGGADLPPGGMDGLV